MGISYSKESTGTEEDLKDVYGVFRSSEKYDRCFHCHKDVPRCLAPAIVWSGSDATGAAALLVMHPECALAFGLLLMRDLYEVNSKVGRLSSVPSGLMTLGDKLRVQLKYPTLEKP